MCMETELSRDHCGDWTDSWGVVVEVSETIGAVNLQDVGTRFPGGSTGH